MKSYFENHKFFICPICGYEFILGFWKRLLAPQMEMWKYRYVKCPRCGEKHWLQARREFRW